MSWLDSIGAPALKNRDFSRIWIGAFVSNIGTWMETLAIGVLVTERTGKAGWTGTFAALAYAPTILLSALGGAAADRVDRRKLIVRLIAVQAALAAVMAILAFVHRLYLPALAFLMLADGCADAILNPTFSAAMAEIVSAEHLLSARTLQSAQYNLARVVGPMLAALVLTAKHGPGPVFLINTLSFIAIIFPCARLVLKPPDPAAAKDGLLHGIQTGVAAARADGGIAAPLVLTFVTALLIAPFIGLAPAYAIKVFGQSAGATSVLIASQGMGAMAAATLATRLAGRWGRRRLLERCALALGPVSALYWLAPTLPLAATAIFFLGGLYMLCLTSVSTSILLHAPRHLQGRVASLYSLLLGSGYAAGLVAQGWLGDRLGNRAVPVVAATLFAGTVWEMRRRAAFAAVDGPGVLLGGGPALAVPVSAPAK